MYKNTYSVMTSQRVILSFWLPLITTIFFITAIKTVRLSITDTGVQKASGVAITFERIFGIITKHITANLQCTHSIKLLIKIAKIATIVKIYSNYTFQSIIRWNKPNTLNNSKPHQIHHHNPAHHYTGNLYQCTLYCWHM